MADGAADAGIHGRDCRMIWGQRWGNVGVSRMPFHAFSCTLLDVIAESAGGNRGSASHFGSEGWGFESLRAHHKRGHRGQRWGQRWKGVHSETMSDERRVIFEANDGSGSVALSERNGQILVVCAEMGGDNAGCEMDRDGIRGLRDALTEWLGDRCDCDDEESLVARCSLCHAVTETLPCPSCGGNAAVIP
jgi:hypothetical protein